MHGVLGNGLLPCISCAGVVPDSVVDFGGILALLLPAVSSGSVNPSAYDEIHRACNEIPV